jgi:pyruvate dehydrogenase E1 component alpha subunit
MHLMDLSVGMVASVPIVASSIPLAVGSALASKRAGSDDVTVVFIGDASVEEGAFHESANFAALYELPVIFVCENNLYSVYTPLHQRQPDRPLSKLAEAHGVTSQQGNGNNAETVFGLTETAVQRAREGGGPSFLLFDTYRWLEHCGPNYDNDIGYRSEDEYLEWAAGCPVKSLEQKLIAEGALSQEDVNAFAAGVSEEITAAMQHAKEAPLPTPEDAVHHVYA